MTTKRFTRDNHTGYLYDNGEIVEDIMELLNALNDENEQLQHDATILIQSNQDYRKKNEELKQQLMDCEKFRHAVYQGISKEMTQHD